jgi:hypothetical protein
METEVELKRCPFCGERPIGVEITREGSGGINVDAFRLSCCVEMICRTKREAVQDWNTRAATIPSPLTTELTRYNLETSGSYVEESPDGEFVKFSELMAVTTSEMPIPSAINPRECVVPSLSGNKTLKHVEHLYDNCDQCVYCNKSRADNWVDSAAQQIWELNDSIKYETEHSREEIADIILGAYRLAVATVEAAKLERPDPRREAMEAGHA